MNLIPLKYNAKVSSIKTKMNEIYCWGNCWVKWWIHDLASGNMRHRYGWMRKMGWDGSSSHKQMSRSNLLPPNSFFVHFHWLFGWTDWTLQGNEEICLGGKRDGRKGILLKQHRSAQQNSRQETKMKGHSDGNAINLLIGTFGDGADGKEWEQIEKWLKCRNEGCSREEMMWLSKNGLMEWSNVALMAK